MGIFKALQASDIKTAKSFLTQLIDVIQEDISGSSSRRKYQVFVTGGVGPGVTSSLFQTVYDQDFTLQTANPIFDATVGIFANSDVAESSLSGIDTAGKELFPSSSLMMREKLDIYRQFAQTLLGDSEAQFIAPYDSTAVSDKIDAAFFITFKRLFTRDSIKKDTFAMKFYQTASIATFGGPADELINNLASTSELGLSIYSDIGASSNYSTTFGGALGRLLDASNTNRCVGSIFYDRGIVVLDLEKIISGSQFASGTIDAMSPTGKLVLGSVGTETEGTAKFIPDFLVSGSIDNIVDHLCGTRFSSGSLSALVFQNVTNINSTLIFCNAPADDFNYSSNPTFVGEDNRIVVIDPGQEDVQQTFTFITSVGIYDSASNLLAIAKLSRPVEKNPERNLTFRVRLDF